MTVFVCVDDQNGMMFNHRRQSRDRAVLERMLAQVGHGRLWLSPYSAKLFDDDPRVRADDQFLLRAAEGDHCFIEDGSLLCVESKIERLIIYRWNRRYPADVYFDIPLAEHGWRLVESHDFAGTSHERVTEEVYER